MGALMGCSTARKGCAAVLASPEAYGPHICGLPGRSIGKTLLTEPWTWPGMGTCRCASKLWAGPVAGGRSVGCLATLLLLSAGSAASQQKGIDQQITSVPSCPRCKIELDSVATLATPDSVDVGASYVVAVDSRGRFHWLAQDGSRVALFDRSGHFLRAYGRRGRGPGEFSTAAELVVGPADSVFVLDRDLRQVTIFNADLSYAGRVPLDGFGLTFALLSSGDFVVNAIANSRSTFGLPLQVVPRRAGAPHWFGSRPSDIGPSRTESSQRAIAAGHRGAIWSIVPLTYQIEEWTSGGSKTRSFQRLAEPFNNTRRSQSSQQPKAWVASVNQDKTGSLWTVMTIVTRPPTTARSGRRATERSEFGMPDLTPYDSVIEVIDPATGRLVAAKRFERRSFGLRGDHLVELREREDGSAAAVVFRYRVTMQG